jgi:hypothetical protein
MDGQAERKISVRSKRYIWFTISILVGLIAGWIYGWYIRTPRSVESSLDMLRWDYKTDYILMVAEVFQSPQDVPLAKSRLVLLGSEEPGEMLITALENARHLNYSAFDLAALADLSKNLQSGVKLTSTPPPGSSPTITTEAPVEEATDE